MNSWRDSVSIEAQEQLDSLYNECIKTAIYFLNKNKEFSPFCISITDTNEVKLMDVFKDEVNILSEDKILDIKHCIKSSNEGFKSVGIVYDVLINKKSNAIKISMEHSEGIALNIIVPYEIKGIFKKNVIIGNTILESVEEASFIH